MRSGTRTDAAPKTMLPRMDNIVGNAHIETQRRTASPVRYCRRALNGKLLAFYIAKAGVSPLAEQFYAAANSPQPEPAHTVCIIHGRSWHPLIEVKDVTICLLRSSRN